MIREIPLVVFDKELKIEEHKFFKYVQDEGWTHNNFPEKYEFYYVIQKMHIFFKKVAFIRNRETKGKYLPRLDTEYGFKLEKEDIKELPNRRNIYIKGMEFKNMYFTNIDKWYNLLEYFKEKHGMTRKYKSKYEHTKYIRKKKFSINMFLFFLKVYKEYRVDNRSREYLAKYYDFSIDNVNKIISKMYKMFNKMKNDKVLIGYLGVF